MSWEEFKRKFNKKYSSPTIEDAHRGEWEKNIAKIKEHNDKYYEGHETYLICVARTSDRIPGPPPPRKKCGPRARKDFPIMTFTIPKGSCHEEVCSCRINNTFAVIL